MGLYNEFCNPYDGEKYDFWMKLEHLGRYLYAADIIENYKSETVLDIACAVGYGSNILAEKAEKVIGCDRNSTYMDEARKSALPNMEFRKVDFENDLEAIENENFDAIVCFETIEHLHNPLKAVEFLYERLKKGGLLIASFPNSVWEHFDENGMNKDIYHLSIVSSEEVNRFFESKNCTIQVLGQSITNRCFNKEHQWVKDGLVDEKILQTKYPYDKESLNYFARLFAYPDQIDIENSYSFILKVIKN